VIDQATIEGAEIICVSSRGDGRQRVLKADHEGSPVVVKCYGLKRGRVETVLRQLGSLLIVGKSSIRSRARFETEREVLALWRREGFDVPDILAVEVTEDVPGPCLVLEWIPGHHLARVIRRDEVTLSRKCELVERFAAATGARHARAIDIREPRLLYEHPAFKQVIVSGERLVHVDFEIVYTWKGDLDRLARREIAGFLGSISRSVEEDMKPVLEAFARGYPDRGRLARVRDELERFGGVPLFGRMAWLAMLPGRRKRARKKSLLVRELGKALS
jgi:tRNA A-37 threonylcarbamoyl transferase component Bud32